MMPVLSKAKGIGKIALRAGRRARYNTVTIICRPSNVQQTERLMPMSMIWQHVKVSNETKPTRGVRSKRPVH